jgi:hypothetical protein
MSRAPRVLQALAGQRWRRDVEAVDPRGTWESVDGRPIRVWHPAPDRTLPVVLVAGTPVLPPEGPLELRPSGYCRREAFDMLITAMDGLQVHRADRSLLIRAEALWDIPDLVILASLTARARQLPPLGVKAPRWE